MKLKFQKLTPEEQERVKANHSFRNYLANLWKGRPATPESWWFEGKSDDWVRDTVYKIAVNANKSTPFAQFFDQNEKKNVEKFGPQGEVPSLRTKEAQEVLEPLYDYRETNNEDYFSKISDAETRQFAEFLFGKQNILSKRRKGFNAVIDDMTDRDTLSSNSGDSRFTKRSTVKSEEVEDAKSGKWRNRNAILLYRYYHAKLRPVWMYPMSRNLIEYQFSQVIQDALRTSPNEQVRNHLTPWEGYDDVKRVLTKQWKRARERNKNVKANGGDTTKMDAETRLAHGKLFFRFVRWLFQKQEWEDLWEAIKQVFTIDLFTGPSSKLTGLHGLASGSGWTQLIETVMILYLMWKHNVQESMGIGDDFECFGDLTAEILVEWLSELKYPANTAKQSSSTVELDFLQRVNCYGFMSVEDRKTLGAYYSLVRAANSIKLPEKYHNNKNWSSDQFCNKFFMVVENTIDDPGFEEFMRWAVKGQKDIVNFAKKSAKELNRIQKIGKTIPGLNPSYNQEKRTKPLSAFYSIKWVREHC